MVKENQISNLLSNTNLMSVQQMSLGHFLNVQRNSSSLYFSKKAHRSFSVLDFLATCPYHLNLLTLTRLISFDCSHPRSSLSLLTLSVKLVPVIISVIHLSQFLFVVARLCTYAHVSVAYRGVERTHETYIVSPYLTPADTLILPKSC